MRTVFIFKGFRPKAVAESRYCPFEFVALLSVSAIRQNPSPNADNGSQFCCIQNIIAKVPLGHALTGKQEVPRKPEISRRREGRHSPAGFRALPPYLAKTADELSAQVRRVCCSLLQSQTRSEAADLSRGRSGFPTSPRDSTGPRRYLSHVANSIVGEEELGNGTSWAAQWYFEC
ncbi:hypothetical protein AVEN_189149-1 [Araneus ventricosus]|uniref:Uncharacterized protein n=1 Tax=Araneus ventricosus TaxID=182803 RepID=A0A4Y2NJ13_ARAVE|nr:hypothetical protein AVEN_189149-1 [Araneus ventricosus]